MQRLRGVAIDGNASEVGIRKIRDDMIREWHDITTYVSRIHNLFPVLGAYCWPGYYHSICERILLDDTERRWTWVLRDQDQRAKGELHLNFNGNWNNRVKSVAFEANSGHAWACESFHMVEPIHRLTFGR